MRLRHAIAGLAAVATAGIGFAIAQEDPLGQLIDKAPEQEAPPPPPGETPPAAAVATKAEPKVEEKVTPPPPVAKAEVKAPPQTRRPRYPIAILLAMDKITAESVRFEARVDKPVSYKGLVFTVRACETTAADEPVRDAIANVEIAFRPPAPPRGKRPGLRSVYKGWMFATSPSISPLEHPVYDAWLIACKADGPVASPVQIQAPVTSPEPKIEPKLSAPTGAFKSKTDAPLAPPPVIPPVTPAVPAPAPAPEARPEPKAPAPKAPPPKAAETIPLY